MSAPDRRLIAILVGGVACVVAGLSVVSCLYATRATGSGGIGSVSGGISEALVEFLLAVGAVGLVGAAVYALTRSRRRTG